MCADADGRFLQLVLSLHGSAWIALGKVVNPLSGKVERDLGAARNSIDMLAMLKEKTKGNLSDEEYKVITGCLSTLQMNYVEEARADEADGGKKPAS